MKTTATKTVEDYLAVIKSTIDQVQQRRLKIREKIAQSKRDYANKHRKDHNFHIDQIVAIKSYKIAHGSGTALLPKFDGPWRISHIDGVQKTAHLEHPFNQSTRKASFANLTPYKRLSELTRTNMTNEAAKLIQPSPKRYNLRPKS